MKELDKKNIISTIVPGLCTGLTVYGAFSFIDGDRPTLLLAGAGLIASVSSVLLLSDSPNRTGEQFIKEYGNKYYRQCCAVHISILLASTGVGYWASDCILGADDTKAIVKDAVQNESTQSFKVLSQNNNRIILAMNQEKQR